MPNMGERFVCGGREFWCVGFDGKTGDVIMHTGAATIQVPSEGFDRTFKKIGALAVDEQYTAKHSLGGIEAGTTYGVTDIKGEMVQLYNGMQIPLTRFFTIF